MKNYRKAIRSTKDFPKRGVIFWDVTPLCEDPILFHSAIADIKKHFQKKAITTIVAIEAKGFVVGAALAYAMRLPLVLIRKPGLTPGRTFAETFQKEYGLGEYQVKQGALHIHDSVLLVYDIMAGSGAAEAGIRLVERTGGKIAGLAFIIELEYLGGRKRLDRYDIFSLVKISRKTS